MSNRDGAAEYYIKNIHGDVVGMTDAEGNLTDNYYYDAFGNEQNVTNDNNPFRYAGEYFDEESGLIYLRNRYYDSSTGRFITEDTYWNTDNMIYGDKHQKYEVDGDIDQDNMSLFEYVNMDVEEIIKNERINILRLCTNLSNFQLDTLDSIIQEWYENSEMIVDTYCVYTEMKIADVDSINQSSNLYVYCLNNPIKYFDFTGHVVVVDDVAIVAGAIVVAAAAGIVYYKAHTKNASKSNWDKHTKNVQVHQVKQRVNLAGKAGQIKRNHDCKEKCYV